MNTAAIIIYIATASLFGIVIYNILKSIEYATCIIRHQIPFVPSSRILRRAVVTVINKYYPGMKSACDIGAGYGGMARTIARRCDMDVTAVENMPITYFILKITNLFARPRLNVVRMDAFKYIKSGERFDIGIAYLGPGTNDRLADLLDNFSVLITLDAPISTLCPTRVINPGRGFTRYGGKKFPHRLFIYERAAAKTGYLAAAALPQDFQSGNLQRTAI